MNHDPLCECAEITCMGCFGCQCDVIAKARADEREKAAQRIISLCAHTKYVGVMPCEHDRAIAAVWDEL